MNVFNSVFFFVVPDFKDYKSINLCCWSTITMTIVEWELFIFALSQHCDVMVLELRQSWAKHSNPSPQRPPHQQHISDSHSNNVLHNVSDKHRSDDAGPTGNTQVSHDFGDMSEHKESVHINKCVGHESLDYRVSNMDNQQSSLNHEVIKGDDNTTISSKQHGLDYITEDTNDQHVPEDSVVFNDDDDDVFQAAGPGRSGRSGSHSHCPRDDNSSGKYRKTSLDPQTGGIPINSGKLSQPLRTLSGSELKLFTSSFDDIEDVRRVGSMRKDSLDVCTLNAMEKEFFNLDHPPGLRPGPVPSDACEEEEECVETPVIELEEPPFFLDMESEEAAGICSFQLNEPIASPDFRPRTLSQILMLPRQFLDYHSENRLMAEEAGDGKESKDDLGLLEKEPQSQSDAGVYRDIEGVEMRLIGSNDEINFDDINQRYDFTVDDHQQEPDLDFADINKPYEFMTGDHQHELEFNSADINQPSDCTTDDDHQEPNVENKQESEHEENSTAESCLYDSLESLTHHSGLRRTESRDSLVEELQDAEMQEFLMQESQILEDAQMQEFLMHESLILDSEESQDADLPPAEPVDTVDNTRMSSSMMADSLMELPVGDDDDDDDDEDSEIPSGLVHTTVPQSSNCSCDATDGGDQDCMPTTDHDASHKPSPSANDDSSLSCFHSDKREGAQSQYASCPDLDEQYDSDYDEDSSVSPNCQAPVTNSDGTSDVVLHEDDPQKLPVCTCHNKHSPQPELIPWMISPCSPGIYDFPDLTLSSVSHEDTMAVPHRLSANYVPSDNLNENPGDDNVGTEMESDQVLVQNELSQNPVCGGTGGTCNNTEPHLCRLFSSDHERSTESHSDCEDILHGGMASDQRKNSQEFEAILQHVRTSVSRERSLEPFSINSESSSESLVEPDSSSHSSSESKSPADRDSGLTSDVRPSSESSMEEDSSVSHSEALDTSAEPVDISHGSAEYESRASRASSVDTDNISSSLFSREQSVDRDSSICFSRGESLEPDGTSDICFSREESVEPESPWRTRESSVDPEPSEFREFSIDREWIMSPAVSLDQLHKTSIPSILPLPRRPNQLSLNSEPITFVETLFSPTLKLQVIEEPREPITVFVTDPQEVDADSGVFWEVTEVREPTGSRNTEDDLSGKVPQGHRTPHTPCGAESPLCTTSNQRALTLETGKGQLLSPLAMPDDPDPCPSPRSIVSRPPPLLTWDEDDEDVASIGTTSSK